MTIRDFLHRTATRFPDHKALWFADETLTYTELEENVIDTAGRFLTMGVKKGDRVALLTEPDNDAIIALLAIQYIGAISVMLNTSLIPSDYLSLCQDVGAEYILLGRSYKMDNYYAHQLAELILPDCVKRVVCIGDKGHHFQRLIRIPSEGEEKVQAAADLVCPEDTAMILFTSGSTSRPKAVMTSHFSRINSGIQQAADLNANENDRFCISMPIFHCFCISANIMAALSVGACICMPVDRHTGHLTEIIRDCGCTVLHSVPTMFNALLSKSDFDVNNYKTLRTGIIAGAGYSPEDFIKVDAAFGPGFTLMSSLGQTELTAGYTVCSPNDSLFIRSTTLGHLMAHVEGKIIDTVTGASLPAGETGEICVRGYLAMQGYYNNPEQTAKTIDSDGWVHTGDLGSLDGQGNLTIRGRIKELIIRGGENISPLEVENAIRKVLDFNECKVVGMPDSHYGEEVCACIALGEGKKADADQLRKDLQSVLAPFKIPRYVLFFDELPKTATGKIHGPSCAAAARLRLAGLDTCG